MDTKQPADIAATSWDFMIQLDNAMNRTKERFVPYMLTTLLGIAGIIGVMIVTGLLAGGVYFAYISTKSIPMTIVLGIVVGIFYIGTLWIASSWMGLAIYKVLLSNEKHGAIETYKSVKSKIWGFWWLNFVMGLFMISLVVWGALSIGIIIVLWVVWATFNTFVFILHDKKGLENVWISKQMVSQRFWDILWRLLVVNGVVFIISFLLSWNAEKYPLLNIPVFLLGIFTTPFLISFKYEMFKNLTVPETVQKPTGWIIMSVIGGILLLVIMIGFFSLGLQTLPRILQNMQQNQQIDPEIIQQDSSMDYDIGDYEEQILDESRQDNTMMQEDTMMDK